MTATFTRAEYDAHLAKLSPEARARAAGTDLHGEAHKVAAVSLAIPGLIWIPRGKVHEGSRSRDWLEKDEQRECWRLLLALGWQVKWLSQAQRSQQSKGLPDLFARHHRRGLLLWVEVKRPDKPSPFTPEQRAFRDDCLPFEHHVLGTEANLRAYLEAQGFELPPPTYLTHA